MSFRILVVAATQAESDVVKQFSDVNGPAAGNHSVELLVTGVGSIATAWALSKWFSANPAPDLAINIGIAGSFRKEIRIGEVVVPVSDCFADAGIETDKGFLTLTEAGLHDTDKFPFDHGLLVSENKFVREITTFLRPVKAITVNTATGTIGTIDRLVGKFDPDIETMESATFFYLCIRERIPFISIRAVSNRVEPRDTSKWNIDLALRNLSEQLGEFLLKIKE